MKVSLPVEFRKDQNGIIMPRTVSKHFILKRPEITQTIWEMKAFIQLDLSGAPVLFIF